MIEKFEVSYPINPVPASRPRVTRWGTYYGKKYKDFKKTMEGFTKDAKEDGSVFMTEAISADMTFFIQMPKSWPKKKKALQLNRFANNNADLDNYEKAILDSLNGVYFDDDKQIVEQSSRKIWAEEGSIKVILKEIEFERK